MELIDNQYCIQDINVLDIAKKYGTPLYLYDASKIKSQYDKLYNAFDVKDLKIHYACKALSNINVLKLMKSLGAGLDAVSISEVKMGLKAGFVPGDIIYTPNCVSVGELEAAVKLGVKMNIDDIEALEYMGMNHPETPLCIRINPHLMAGGNENISVGHIDSKFGISIHQLPLILRIVKALNIKIEGVHMHTGSDILDVEVFNMAADILFQVADNFEDLKYIDFGSGFKVKYKPNDYETPIQSFGQSFSKKFNAYCQSRDRDIRLMFEPGKFLVSEAGHFLVRTNLIKQTTSTIFAGVDSGFNHLLRPMFYDAHHDIINISNPYGSERIYTVVGYICETDTFAYNRRISEIKENDILCFNNAGAYCFMMSSNYNSRKRPAEVLIHNGKDYLIRERESFDDLLRNQVEQDIEF